MVKVRPFRNFEGVYQIILDSGERRLATVNLAPGVQVYGERLVKVKGVEYRLWDPYRSKLGAALLKGLKRLPIKRGVKVLYLGAAAGTTLSHVSDIIGEDGLVYGVEFSPRAMRDFIKRVSAHRENVVPILADARFPEKYLPYVEEVDVIYCDIAQPDQARILSDNADFYLEKGGSTLLAVKARSIDVSRRPVEIFKEEAKVLRSRGFKVEATLRLEPFDKDHVLILSRR
ncbi:fibrillarin-like rRNA/tRNA 2'-O-methyltransferase [Candidatus Bathyarchaeota archaeon]|nr:fibrillarin-like rRNA/tRNA 2'-O-methyltransferase [Candidatus Bathyarchaeota archaeon]RJS74942.1 MAG: fibrillarin-like rRNA/tRNA 2'-O-methyltransferase [Candidatus Bathyarchaeota archaeon]